MNEVFMRIAENLSDRVSGPMHLRIYLQPLMATIFAVLDGIKDAKTGKPPYFWSLVTDPSHRTEMLRSGWKSVGKVFLIAVALDVVYQLKVLKFLYPGELVIVAVRLAIIPYLLLRGVVTRVVRGRGPKTGAGRPF